MCQAWQGQFVSQVYCMASATILWQLVTAWHHEMVFAQEDAVKGRGGAAHTQCFVCPLPPFLCPRLLVQNLFAMHNQLAQIITSTRHLFHCEYAKAWRAVLYNSLRTTHGVKWFLSFSVTALLSTSGDSIAVLTWNLYLPGISWLIFRTVNFTPQWQALVWRTFIAPGLITSWWNVRFALQ